MKGKKFLLIIILAAFVLLMVGAYNLYDGLKDQVQSSQLMTSATQQPTDAPEATDEPEATDMPEATDVPEADDEQAERVLAPDFTVYDLEGNSVTLHQFIGKPIVLNFWASWCGPCQMEMPDFHDKYLEIGQEVQFLMINMTGGRETLESASKFIADSGYTFPVFYDTQADAAYTYGAYSLPTTYFIDAQGYAAAYAVGAIDAETLQIGLDMIYFPDGE